MTYYAEEVSVGRHKNAAITRISNINVVDIIIIGTSEIIITLINSHIR